MYLIAHVRSACGKHAPPSLALPLTADTLALIRGHAQLARTQGKDVTLLLPGIQSCALNVAADGRTASSADGVVPVGIAYTPGHAFVNTLPPLPEAFWAEMRNDISVRGIRIDPRGTLVVFAWAEHDIVVMHSTGLSAQHILDRCRGA